MQGKDGGLAQGQLWEGLTQTCCVGDERVNEGEEITCFQLLSKTPSISV